MGEIDGLAAVEEALDSSGADVTHLRCGYFFSNLELDLDSLRDGVLATAMDPDRPLPWVAPQDIAAVAAARLLAPSWSGRHVQGVHGPSDLSFREAAQILSTVLGRPIDLVPLTDDQVPEQLTEVGMSPAQVAALAGMTAGTRDHAATEPRTARTTTPMTLAAWAAQNLAQLRV